MPGVASSRGMQEETVFSPLPPPRAFSSSDPQHKPSRESRKSLRYTTRGPAVFSRPPTTFNRATRAVTREPVTGHFILSLAFSSRLILSPRGLSSLKCTSTIKFSLTHTHTHTLSLSLSCALRRPRHARAATPSTSQVSSPRSSLSPARSRSLGIENVSWCPTLVQQTRCCADPEKGKHLQ